MPDIVHQSLAAKEQHETLQALCKETVDLIRKSRNDMRRYYDTWDANYACYKGEILRDDADMKAAERKEPEKLVVPFLYSQTMAFIAFINTLYTSRKTFLELEPVGQEDVKSYRLAEAVLDHNFRYNKWSVIRFQVLQDLALTNIGCVQLSWERKTKRVLQTTPPSTQIINGIPIDDPGGEQVEVEKVTYEGNRLRAISPYNIFPDTRLPIARYEEGEFIGSYDQFTKMKLRKMEADGFFIGTKHIDDIEHRMLNEFQGLRLPMFSTLSDSSPRRGREETSQTAVAVVHVQRWIIPSEYEIDGEPIGTEDYPCLYDIWIANESRIIRLEKNAQAFDRFTYFIGNFDCSLHELVPDGLASKIQELQFVASWLFNSHITSIRKTIQNWLVADPTKVEMEDLKNRNPVIRLKQTARSGGIDNAIKQLDVRDFTQSHISDVAVIEDLIKMTTGLNDNLLGQINSGRRSAKEAAQAFNASASRLELVAANIDEQLFRALGEGMMDNISEYMSEETLIRIEGYEAEQTPDWLTALMQGTQAMTHEGTVYIKLYREDIQGQYNFRFVETTSASQRSILGAMLVEVFDRLSQNPQAALMANIDPGKIIREAMKLNGVTNLNQFGFNPQQFLRANAMFNQPNPGSNGEPSNGSPSQRPQISQAA